MDIASTADRQEWSPLKVMLEFSFAGRRIATRAFEAQVYNIPYEARTPDPVDGQAASRLTHSGASLLFCHPVTQRVPRLSLREGALRYVARHYHRYRVETVGTFDAYLATLSTKTRQTLKRKVRRYCSEVGDEAPWMQFKTPDELRTFHGLARTVAEKSYQQRLFGAGIPESPAFLDEVFAQGRSARGYLLLRQGAPVAYMYTQVHRQIALYTYLGYDPAFAMWSPGAVLQYFALHCMFEDPDIALLDFAEGEGQHKAVFATAGLLCADVYYFKPNVSNVLTVGAHLAVSLCDRAGAWLVGLTGQRGAVRRLLRG